MRQPLVEHRLELAGFETRALEIGGDDRIEAPILLVWGDRDRMVTHRGSRHLVEALGRRGDFGYELYENCGHCPQVEMPDRLTRSILSFAPCS
jgi:pimeloyl-ACP methyl ester carboxylesterase